MPTASNSDIAGQLRLELDQTRARLIEAKEIIQALQNGEVDGLAVAGSQGRQIFTLAGAEEPYRLLIEQMSEGAMTLSLEGVILYANNTLAHLLQVPLERLIGSEFRTFVSSADQPILAALMEGARDGSCNGEFSNLGAKGLSVPFRLGLSPLHLNAKRLICGVATDLTEARKQSDDLRRLNASLENRVTDRTAALVVANRQAVDLMEDAISNSNVLEAANRQIKAEMAQRQQMEESLRESEQRFRLLVENSSQLIVQVKQDGSVVYASPNHTAITGWTPGEMAAANLFERVHPDDRVGARQEFTHPNPTAELRYRFKDGSWHWLHVSGRQFTSPGGETQSVIVLRDITEQKRVQAAMQEMHVQLMATSHQAGMAEIASNVLHNVGNVLNSANVSADLIVESIKKSRTANLSKVVLLLQEHANDLGEFITHDPKGKQVPAYLSQLSAHLVADQKAIVSEVDSLRQNIEHIKQIVAVQQGYAKRGGMKETISLVGLLRDSLHLNEAALNRHAVKIIREFETVPSLSVDKHKILQILVNLLRNAKHACVESGRPDKQITLRLASSEGRIRISVKDNGVGIPAENMTRIFSHGFTTRKDGHGFGLNSGALAAQEMGGSLTAQSDGPGQGATFTLELPCPAAEDKA